MVGIGRRIVLSVLFVLTYLLCPIAMSPVTSSSGIVGYACVSLFCTYVSGSITGGEIAILSGPEYWLSNTALMIPFALVFSVEVINCINGKTSKNRVFNVGLLSLVFPGLFLTFMYYPVFLQGITGYAGPIPIQFIIGMGIVSKYGYHIEVLEW